MSKALGCVIGGDFVGFLVNGIRCAEVKRVLLLLRLKVLDGLPKVIVRVPRLEGSEFKWVHTRVVLKWPRKPPVGVNVFNATPVGCAAYGKKK